MSLFNVFLVQYKRIVPKRIRKKISPKIKKALKMGVYKKPTLPSENSPHYFEGNATKSTNKLSEAAVHLLDVSSTTQEKRMLMIVGNIITLDSRVLKSAKSMQDAGFHVVLIGMRPLDGTIELTNFGSIPGLILSSYSLKISKDPEVTAKSIAQQLQPIIRLYDPTHIYSHDFFGLAFVSESIGAFNENRYCHWTHDIHEYVPGLEGVIAPERIEWAQKLEEDRLSIPDNIIVVNEEIRDLMSDLFSPHQRIDILYNVPRKSKDTRFNLRAACGLDETTPLGVYTGRATALRGLDVNISALSAIPDLNIALLSETAKPYLKSLKAKASAIGAGERLHIFPYLSDDEVMKGIESADFGLAPFKKYGNTELALPTKLFEYLHAGLPVVASDCRAMKRFINENKCGEVFQSEDEAEFIKSIKKVLEHDKSHYALDRKKLEKFAWEKHYSAIAQYLVTTGCFDKSSKIFHGPGASAGQPKIISETQRSLGKEAYCVNIVSNSSFAYEKDILFPYHNGIKDPRQMLYWAVRRFGIFHFYFRTTSNYIINKKISNELFQDVHLIRALGGKAIMHFRGTEVRLQTKFEKNNPFAWTQEEDPFPYGDRLRSVILKRADKLFDKILVTDPELQSYVPGSHVLQRAVNLDKIDQVLREQSSADQNKTKKIRIAHAPSRRALKGTQLILDTIQSLIDEGANIELDLIEGVTNEEALKRISLCDIVIDQMRIGWYGVLAVEAMAMSKPTIAYIREDLKDKLEPDCPIIISNPNKISDDLSHLLSDSKRLVEIGKKSRQFVENYHCSSVVAKKALDIYNEL